MRQRKLVLRSAVAGVVVTLTLAICAGAATEKILHTFTGGNDGDEPVSTLIFDLKRNLYGTTPAGGLYGDGTVFELSPNSNGSWTESVLYNFGAYAGDGIGPLDYSSLTFDSTGNLYGTTRVGGNASCSFSNDGCGTVFELTPDSGGWKEKILYNFTGGSDGGLPDGGVIFDQHGNLYGMVEVGGNPSCACGTVFKLSPGQNGNWNFSVLHTFDESDGSFPFTGLSLDPSGLLWGTTNSGGPNGSMGIVFNLKRDGSKYQVVSSFDYQEGDQPGLSTPLFGKAGHVFGNTASGGSCDEGTVFMLFPSGTRNYNRKTIDCFGASGDGNTPLGNLLLSPFGHIYGTTRQGGSEQSQLCKTEGGCGTLYELVWHKGKGWKETVLYRFKGGTDGYYPWAGVAMDKSGNLFGTTTYGGAYNAGTVFEVTP